MRTLQPVFVCAWLCSATLAVPVSLAKSGRADVFEITKYKLKPGTSFDDAKKWAADLNPVYKQLKGFEDRELYFDATQSVWIERVKWKHSDAAKAGREALNKDKAVQKLQSAMDPASIQTFQGERQLEFEP